MNRSGNRHKSVRLPIAYHVIGHPVSANSEDSYQTELMPALIWIISWRTVNLLDVLMSRLILDGYGRMSRDMWLQQCGILTSVDSDEPVQPPFKLINSKWRSVSSLTLIEFQARSDCAYAQADLSLCWSHIPHCWKPHACRGSNYSWDQLWLIHTEKNLSNGHSQKDQKTVLSIPIIAKNMQGKSIAECSRGKFCNTFDLH